MFRLSLLANKNYSQPCSLIYNMFRKSLDYVVDLKYLDVNLSKRKKSISKGKASIPFWTKEEFEKVIETFYRKNYCQYIGFVVLWLYYVTRMRVSEGLALYWNDIDFKQKKLKIHHNLDYQNKNKCIRKPYTKKENGKFR